MRHRAVIVGEDLGTVPEGFREQLAECGLLGMRVLWFEREFGLFRDPSRWPADVVATTTTHDVPTVAGWWREREDDDRRALWAAFNHAGVTKGEPPPPDQPAAAIDAAVAFVGRTPSRLAMVPLEDLAGVAGQTNVPGTTDEHPNWRRRMPQTVEGLFQSREVPSRLDRLRTERGRT